jgi:uridine phosphorylase
VTVPQSLPPLLRVGHPVAARAILVGDPGRALALAQSLLERPLMSNHARGLWGYTGTAADGAPLSVLSTGTGGPSAAAVLREVVEAGVRRVVRAGSATASGPAAVAGSLRAVTFAAAYDGTSRALGVAPGTEVRPHGGMLERLRSAGPAATGVVSVDLLPADGGPTPPSHPGATVVDRQSAAVLAAAARLGVPAAVVLALPTAGQTDDERGAWWRALGDAAVLALGPA